MNSAEWFKDVGDRNESKILKETEKTGKNNTTTIFGSHNDISHNAPTEYSDALVNPRYASAGSNSEINRTNLIQY
jgi:hypothetical protein